MPASTSAMAGSGIRKKRVHKYLCGVPAAECFGSNTSASSGLHKGCKMHMSPQDAHKCYGRYLISQGYKQVGNREYAKEDGPIVVLCKKSRFGHRCRGGKGERQMPSGRMVGGCVIDM